MTPERRQARGSEAQRIIEHPLVDGAMKALDAAYVETWRRSAASDAEARERAYVKMQVLKEFRAEFEALIDDGALAGAELKART